MSTNGAHEGNRPIVKASDMDEELLVRFLNRKKCMKYRLLL